MPRENGAFDASREFVHACKDSEFPDRCRLSTGTTMSEAMQQQFGLIRRPWGVYYLKNRITGDQISLKTRDKLEAQRLLQAHNNTKSQPEFNLALARVYINGAEPKLGTRTWQDVMEHIVLARHEFGLIILDPASSGRLRSCLPGASFCEGGQRG